MKQAGFTLLELLLVLLLTTLCAGIVFKLFVFYSEQSRYLTAYADLLNEARYIRLQLTSKIELAGLTGCRRLSTISVNYLGDKSISFNSQSVFKIIYNQYGPQINIVSIDPLIDFSFYENARQLTVLGLTPKYKVGDKLLITDCQHLAMDQVVGVSTSKAKQQQFLTLLVNLPSYYAQDNLVGLVKSEKFYLMPDKSAHSLILYLQNYRQRDSKLASGIAALSLFCLLKTANGIEIKPASKISNWSAVKAVYVNLLLRSAKPVFNQPHYYYYLHQRYMASDKHLYKQFGFLILLRERVGE